MPCTWGNKDTGDAPASRGHLWHPTGSGCTEPGPESESFLFHCTGSLLRLLSTSTGSTYARLNDENSTHVFVYLIWRSSLIYFPCFPLSKGPRHTETNVCRLFTVSFSPHTSLRRPGFGKTRWLLSNSLCSLELPPYFSMACVSLMALSTLRFPALSKA